MDAAAPGLLLAQAIGRWGNYFNQELFGGPTTLPWGLQIDPDNPNFPPGMPTDTLFHPTFLYESLWNLAGVLILLALDRKFSFRRGRLFCVYAMYYTLGRVWIEAMRIDDAEQITLFGLTTRLNVWTSIIVFAGALLAFILLGLRKRSEPDTPFLPGRAPAETQPAGHAGGDRRRLRTRRLTRRRPRQSRQSQSRTLTRPTPTALTAPPAPTVLPTPTAPPFPQTRQPSAIRTPLSQIVNPVLISGITKADQFAHPRMRTGTPRAAPRPPMELRQPEFPAARELEPRRRLRAPSSSAPAPRVDRSHRSPDPTPQRRGKRACRGQQIEAVHASPGQHLRNC